MIPSIFRTFWGGLVGLIALMLILEKAGGLSRILAASGGFVGTTVRAFK
jgi:hypothetical protein